MRQVSRHVLGVVDLEALEAGVVEAAADARGGAAGLRVAAARSKV